MFVGVFHYLKSVGIVRFIIKEFREEEVLQVSGICSGLWVQKFHIADRFDFDMFDLWSRLVMVQVCCVVIGPLAISHPIPLLRLLALSISFSRPFSRISASADLKYGRKINRSIFHASSGGL